MLSWEAMPDHDLTSAAEVTQAFLDVGVRDLRAAARYLNRLPYGRNASRIDPLAVMREGRGTCGTKHALLKRLAIEQKIDIVLMLGIYEMTERNTPGVGCVLDHYGLACLPEAHCYLRYRGERVDVTRELSEPLAAPIGGFLHQEEIAPEQIGEYKLELHRRFIRDWIAADFNTAAGRSFEQIWLIRERCIAALSG